MNKEYIIGALIALLIAIFLMAVLPSPSSAAPVSTLPTYHGVEDAVTMPDMGSAVGYLQQNSQDTMTGWAWQLGLDLFNLKTLDHVAVSHWYVTETPTKLTGFGYEFRDFTDWVYVHVWQGHSGWNVMHGLFGDNGTPKPIASDVTSPAPVPLPAPLMMLAAALGGLVLLRRGQRRRAVV